MLVALSASVSAAPKLDGAQVLAMGECRNMGTVFPCAILLFEKDLYLAVADNKGLRSLYLIISMPKNPDDLDETMLKLIWSRDAT